MAYIAKTRGAWRVCWREGGRGTPIYTRGAPDKRTAEQLKRQIEQNIAIHGKGIVEVDRPPLLHERLEAWIDAKRPELQPRTAAYYGDGMVLFLRFIEEEKGRAADQPVTILNRELLAGFHGWLLKGGRERSTASKRLATVHQAWNWLYEGEDGQWLDRPPQKIPVRRSPTPPPRAPTWEQCDACVEACRHLPWMYRLAVLLRFTGMRRSEAVMLLWKFVDLDACTLTIPAAITKGEYGGRTVPISPHFAAEMHQWRRDGDQIVGAPPCELSAAENDGRGHVDRLMRRAWTRAGVPEEKWAGQPLHAFRKAMETELMLLGADWEAIELLVGHKLPGTGGRHYLDARGPWPRLVKAVSLIPPLPMWPEAKLLPFPGSAKSRATPVLHPASSTAELSAKNGAFREYGGRS